MPEKKTETCIVQINKNNITLVLVPYKYMIEHVMHDDSLFARVHGIGYWARGVEHNPRRGWLVFEHGGEVESPDKAPQEVMTTWRNGGDLPERWFCFDREFAMRVQAEAVKMYGIKYEDNMDGPSYDKAVQMAIFGKEKYA